jgi:hypothetical protein
MPWSKLEKPTKISIVSTNTGMSQSNQYQSIFHEGYDPSEMEELFSSRTPLIVSVQSRGAIFAHLNRCRVRDLPAMIEFSNGVSTLYFQKKFIRSVSPGRSSFMEFDYKGMKVVID